MATKTRTQKVIIESAAGGEWFVMFDDGSIQVVGSPDQALAVVSAEARRGNRGITLTKIEWRNVPAGFVAPNGGK